MSKSSSKEEKLRRVDEVMNDVSLNTKHDMIYFYSSTYFYFKQKYFTLKVELEEM